MRKLTQNRLKEILTRGLKLREPEFRLETYGGRISGAVIDPAFQGADDMDRQKRIWDVLDAELGSDSVRSVGMVLAYTPGEWDVPRTINARERKAG